MKFDYNRNLILQVFLLSNYSGHRWLPTPFSSLEKSVNSHLVYKQVQEVSVNSYPNPFREVADSAVMWNVNHRLFILLCSSDYGMSTPLRLSWHHLRRSLSMNCMRSQLSEIFNNSTRTSPNYSIAMQT